MKLKNNEINSKLNNLKEKISRKLIKLRSLPDELKIEKNDDIKEMIRYYIDLTDKIEDRRVRIHTFGLQLLAISATGLALLFSQYDEIESMDLAKFLIWPVTLILSVLILSSLISSIFYVRQSWFRYPFLKLKDYGNNKWKWFYYGNEEILKISTNPFSRQRNLKKTLEPYLSGLSNFLSNYKDENLDKEISDNIQQLYLLQVHNYYKNRFYLQLTKIWKWSFSIVIIILVSAALYLIFS